MDPATPFMLPAQAVPPSNANTASTPTSRAIIAESFLPPSAYSRSTRIAPPFPARQSASSRSAPARVKAPAGGGPSVTTKLPEQHAAGLGLHRLRMDGQEMIAQKVRLQHLFPVLRARSKCDTAARTLTAPRESTRQASRLVSTGRRSRAPSRSRAARAVPLCMPSYFTSPALGHSVALGLVAQDSAASPVMERGELTQSMPVILAETKPTIWCEPLSAAPQTAALSSIGKR